MNNQPNITSLYLYYLTLFFSVLISIPYSYAADDDRRQYMDMGYGHMGHGHMGYGHMGYGHMGSGQMGLMGMGYRFLDNLDLSNQQRTKIRNIHKKIRSQQFALQDKIAELNDELSSLYKEDKPNAKKVGEIYKKIFNLKQQQIELVVTTKNKTYDILDEKQKEKLKEYKSSVTDYRSHKNMHRCGGMRHMMD